VRALDLIDTEQLRRGERVDLLEDDGLRDLRTAVRAAFEARIAGAPPPPAAVDALNAAAGAPVLRWDADGPRAEHASPHAAIAADAIAVLAGPEGDLLRACGAHGCIRLFLATDPRRRWCSTRCGDRVRVARHAARGRLRDASA
jgi:predicted RNA-binding Zn ribbon-like protein